MTTQTAVLGDDGVRRCAWAVAPGMMRDYHDHEWGRPVLGEAAVFERLCLEGFQAGLSWATILRKRDHYRDVYRNFDVDFTAAMSDADLDRLLTDPGIVRNGAKVNAARTNARATQRLRDDVGLETLIASFAPTDEIRPHTHEQVPTQSAESLALSKALKKRGFSFVGPTTMFALMEATGLVNSHLLDCHRR